MVSRQPENCLRPLLLPGGEGRVEGECCTKSAIGARGWLTNTLYANNTGPKYTYTPAGRLKSRVWARTVGGQPLATWYTNNNAGEVWVVNYTDSTPDVTNSYDRHGRLTNTLQGSISQTKVYNDAGSLLRESYAGGPLHGVGVTNFYDHLWRRTNVATAATSIAYAYDAASRLEGVSDGGNSAAYAFLANSPLVAQLTIATNGAPVMTTTKGYDFLNRLTNTTTVDASAGTVDTHAYVYNPAQQRTSVTNVDGSYWVYSLGLTRLDGHLGRGCATRETHTGAKGINKTNYTRFLRMLFLIEKHEDE